MCPLRIILIFLSATLAGFFVIRNLKSPKSKLDADADADADADNNVSVSTKISDFADTSFTPSAKVCAAVQSGFWTFVDMASGRYLWRHMVNSPSNKAD